MSRDKKLAVVTGANRGIGAETARLLAAEGMFVVLACRHQAAAERAAASIRALGGEAEGLRVDVGHTESIAILGRHLRENHGRLDVLVNNAAIFPEKKTHRFADMDGTALAVDPEDVLETLRVNSVAPLVLCQQLLPLMREGGYGRVVNVSSGMGQLSGMGPAWPGYRMSKTALNALTRILAAETRDENIKINAVCPGWVQTDMGGPDALRSPVEAAAGIVWAATLPDDGPSGGFFRDGQPLEW